jgi:hypothetical protein
MKKNSAIILLFIITVFIIVFIFFPPPWINEDTKGCTDPIATNYYINANVDDSSCVYKGSLSINLQNKVDELINSAWSKVDFKNLRTEILSFYHSEGKQGSLVEENSLSNLNSDYMSVLHKETKKVSGKCFSKSSALKKEVSIFYKKYKKNNKEIRYAKSIFNTRDKIFSYQKKVKSLLKKKYDKQSYYILRNDIDNFKNKSSYKSYIKPCKSLRSDLDKSLVDLRSFQNIDNMYNNQYLKDLSREKNRWESDGLPIYYPNKFKNYQWYYNQLKPLIK